MGLADEWESVTRQAYERGETVGRFSSVAAKKGTRMNNKDGGPAFPARIPLIHDDDQGKDYPNYEESGMSLRDWFAGQAMTAIITHNMWETDADHERGVARAAYILAATMIAERDQK